MLKFYILWDRILVFINRAKRAQRADRDFPVGGVSGVGRGTLDPERLGLHVAPSFEPKDIIRCVVIATVSLSLVFSNDVDVKGVDRSSIGIKCVKYHQKGVQVDFLREIEG